MTRSRTSDRRDIAAPSHSDFISFRNVGNQAILRRVRHGFNFGTWVPIELVASEIGSEESGACGTETAVENASKSTLAMHTLLLCADVPFLGITRSVLDELQVTPRIVNTSAAALAMVQAHEFDVVIVDWREIDNLADFLCAVRRSKQNQDCVLVAI